MLHEGPIPGVRVYSGLLPGMKSDMSYVGMGALGQLTSRRLNVAEVVAGVMDGTLYGQLRAWQRRQMENNAFIAAKKLELERMAEGPAKSAALSAWSRADAANRDAYSAFEESKARYNEVVRAIMIGAGTIGYNVSYPQLAGLGLPAAAIPIAGLVTLGAVSTAAILFSAAFYSLASKADRVVDALANLARGTGEVIGQTTDLFRTLAVAGAVGFGGYLLMQFLKKRGKI